MVKLKFCTKITRWLYCVIFFFVKTKIPLFHRKARNIRKFLEFFAFLGGWFPFYQVRYFVITKLGRT